MALDFPNSPTVGSIFTSGGRSWQWDATKWLAITNVQPQLSNPNKLLNPFMEIDQANEGLAVAITNTGHYSADGWVTTFWTGGGGAANGGRVAAGPPGNPYEITINTTTGALSVAANDNSMFMQYIEADELYDTFFGTAQAQPLTMSFWVYCTISGTYYLSLRNGSGTVTRCYVAPFTINTASTWQLVALTIPGDTTGTWTINGNTVGATIGITLGAGTGQQTATLNAWQNGNFIAGSGMNNAFMTTTGAIFRLGPCKLEVGSQATPMLRQSFQSELSRCQRYYEKSYDVGNAPGNTTAQNTSHMNINMSSATFTTGSSSVRFQVTKRVQPTVTVYSPSTGVAGKARDNTALQDVTGNVGDPGMNGFRWLANMYAASQYLDLAVHWVADARL